eukprot:scaffold97747_cov105-Phaeocystis_antarctica.AAC.2
MVTRRLQTATAPPSLQRAHTRPRASRDAATASIYTAEQAHERGTRGGHVLQGCQGTIAPTHLDDSKVGGVQDVRLAALGVQAPVVDGRHSACPISATHATVQQDLMQRIAAHHDRRTRASGSACKGTLLPDSPRGMGSLLGAHRVYNATERPRHGKIEGPRPSRRGETAPEQSTPPIECKDIRLQRWVGLDEQAVPTARNLEEERSMTHNGNGATKRSSERGAHAPDSTTKPFRISLSVLSTHASCLCCDVRPLIFSTRGSGAPTRGGIRSTLSMLPSAEPIPAVGAAAPFEAELCWAHREPEADQRSCTRQKRFSYPGTREG